MSTVDEDIANDGFYQTMNTTGNLVELTPIKEGAPFRCTFFSKGKSGIYSLVFNRFNEKYYNERFV